MRNVINLAYVLAALSLLYANISQSMPLSGPQMEAENVVMSYHSALTQGDTTTIKSLLGGDLLKKRRRLLDNPTYPEHLIRIYNGSTMEIVRNSINNGLITVEVNIILETGTTQKRRYLLKRNEDPASPYSYNIFSDTSADQD